MAMKDQFRKLKDNWLLIAIVLVLFVGMNMFNGGSSFAGMALGGSYAKSVPMYEVASDYAMAESAFYRGGVYTDENFAPDVEERVITKSASMSTEVERGEFNDAATKLKAIIKSSDGFILDENVNKQDSGWKSYYDGYYSLKVETSKYDAVLKQLMDIGEVQSFNENMDDITGRYVDTQTRLDGEKDRLARYKEMYNEATNVADKITLSDRIFDQERTIKYLEESIKNMDNKVDYSTVYVSINEKRSEYANIVFVKISALIRSLVNSVNSLLTLVFVVIPYAIATLLIWWIVKVVRNRK